MLDNSINGVLFVDLIRTMMRTIKERLLVTQQLKRRRKRRRRRLLRRQQQQAR